MANFDKVILNGTTYTIPSGGGGTTYTAGEGIDITNDVISADTDEQNKVIASALTELHNDKADKQQLNNYQLKGDYQTGAQVDAKIATATSGFRSEAEAINVEKVDAAALNDLNSKIAELNDRIEALERTVHDLDLSIGSINQNITDGVQLFGEAVVNAGGFAALNATDSATALAELGYQPQE